jgi:uncharacterized repeat protein (TIGR03803 family)
MKKYSFPYSFTPRMVACLAAFALTAFLPAIANAQLKVLKTFPVSALDGSKPTRSGVVIGAYYYGIASSGGANGKGVIYRMNLDGTNFTKLKDLDATMDPSDSDGGSILTSEGKIYVILNNSTNNIGDQRHSLYKIDPNSMIIDKIYSFRNYSSGELKVNNGHNPEIKFLDANNIYGICSYGGDGNEGTIFKINLDGSGFDTLHNFTGGSDGDQPIEIIDGGTAIYGITRYGGIANKGTIFKINKDRTGYQQLRYMTGGDDGLTSIAVSGSQLFVASEYGGEATAQAKNPQGFIFSINTDGSGYKNIKTFNYATTKIDSPTKIFIQNNLIYGVSSEGGTDEKSRIYGGLFKMNLDGSGFTQLAGFDYEARGVSGKNPSGLIFSNGVLYGTNSEGGTGGLGTVYSLSVGGSSPNPTPTPAPTTQAMYGAVTFTAKAFFPQSGAPTTKKSGNTQTLTEPVKMATYSISNALVLQMAVDAALIPSISGYSIICPDDFDSGVEFFAYKKGLPLVSLSPIISFTEALNVQAATKITTTDLSTFAETVSQFGMEKSYGTGKFNDMSLAMNRTITFKSGTIKINGVNATYFPSTTTGTFFGGAEDGTLYVEGKFSIAASKPINVPTQ